jgi:hypothetical protein
MTLEQKIAARRADRNFAVRRAAAVRSQFVALTLLAESR